MSRHFRFGFSLVPQVPARCLGGNLGAASICADQVSVKNRREAGATGLPDLCTMYLMLFIRVSAVERIGFSVTIHLHAFIAVPPS
jgi:hypothetical protein